MYYTDATTKTETWIRVASIQVIEHPEPTIFRLLMEGGLETKIYFEGGLHDLVREMGLRQTQINRGVKVMTSRDAEMNAKHFIVRDHSPKYFGEEGWTDRPYFFPTEALAKAVAEVL